MTPCCLCERQLYISTVHFGALDDNVANGYPFDVLTFVPKLYIMDCLREHDRMSIAAMAAKLGMSQSAIAKNIKLLKEEGRLQRVGPDKGGYWRLLK